MPKADAPAPVTTWGRIRNDVSMCESPVRHRRAEQRDSRSHVSNGVHSPWRRVTRPPTPALGTGDGLAARHVLLCRGVTDTTDLADWWRMTHAPKRSAARTVEVELIDPGSTAPLLTWTFSGCRAVQLSHSPLDAMVATVITESLVFEYADVDIH